MVRKNLFLIMLLAFLTTFVGSDLRATIGLSDDDDYTPPTELDKKKYLIDEWGLSRGSVADFGGHLVDKKMPIWIALFQSKEHNFGRLRLGPEVTGLDEIIEIPVFPIKAEYPNPSDYIDDPDGEKLPICYWEGTIKVKIDGKKVTVRLRVKNGCRLEFIERRYDKDDQLTEIVVKKKKVRKRTGLITYITPAGKDGLGEDIDEGEDGDEGTGE